MLAILLSPHMDTFYSIAGSFPTAIWTVLLGFFMIYWLSAVLGIVPIDIVTLDSVPSDLDPGQSLENGSALVGLMMRLGLVGIPLTISFSFLTLIAWTCSFFIVYFSPEFLIQTWFKWPFGVFVFVGTGFIGLVLTGFVVRPLKPLFLSNRAVSCHQFVGALAQVRTSRVDEKFGEAHIVDGGAGLIVQVRADVSNSIASGDAVVILSYDSKLNVFQVAIADDA